MPPCCFSLQEQQWHAHSFANPIFNDIYTNRYFLKFGILMNTTSWGNLHNVGYTAYTNY